MVQGLLAVLTQDARFRDLPIAVLGAGTVIDRFQELLVNLERVDSQPARVLDWMLPLVRLRAFEARLKRMLATLDAGGMVDPNTGLLTGDAFWCEISRAVDEAARRGAGLCVARIAFDADTSRRASMDAARLVSRIVRNSDFACRDDDGSILVVFTDTELRAAHVVAGRIAGLLKRTMLVSERASHRPQATVTLATLKPTDTVETLATRVGSRTVAVA
jgi:GGDEF domain-containing protein